MSKLTRPVLGALLLLCLGNGWLLARPLNPDSDYFWPVVIVLMILSIPLGFFIGSALGMMVAAMAAIVRGRELKSARNAIKIGGTLGSILGPALVYFLVIL
ncbi:MAG TPA: hypothetical protein PKV71_17870 [Calditrichia bacterium]|nr:hypothetical protein [Calditrichia bacterium]HQV33759.1 hypothetical protein [Calditrichia bacterium]